MKGKVDRSKVSSDTSSFGATQPAGKGGSLAKMSEAVQMGSGKSNEADAVLRTGKQPKPEAVTEAKYVEGKVAQSIKEQRYKLDGSPKLRGDLIDPHSNFGLD